ncbi:MAG: hypothetical protein DHS20C21_00100 [Gemmatimonadota bacterium]|nr:MAG: hypothetical protein DHS20C21_00100 [Gemmatimonadota bacterium]
MLPLDIGVGGLTSPHSAVMSISIPSEVRDAVAVSLEIAGTSRAGLVSSVQKPEETRVGLPHVSFYLPAPGVTRGAWGGSTYLEEGSFRLRLPMLWSHHVARSDRLSPQWGALDSAIVSARLTMDEGMAAGGLWRVEPSVRIWDASLVFELPDNEAAN